MQLRAVGVVVVVVAGCGVPERDGTSDAQPARCGDPDHTADFDHDGSTDLCDACPITTDNLGDDDRDGVADSCDPRPGFVDRWLAFVPFYDDSSIAGWSRTGTWTAHDGLEQPSSTTPASITDPTPREVSAVAAELSVWKRSDNATVAVCLEHPDDSHACCELDLAHQRVFVRVGGSAAARVFPNFFAYYDPIKVQMMIAGGELRCRVTQRASVAEVALPATTSTARLRLTTDDAFVRLRYLTLFGDGPPLPPPSTHP